MAKYNRAQQKAAAMRQTHTFTRVEVKEIEVQRTKQVNLAWGIRRDPVVVVRRVA
jgi:hypothetical protein